MIRPTFAILLFVTSIVVPIGCGDDDDDESSGYLASCERACARVNECAGTDTQTCLNNCRNTYAATGPNASSQFLAAWDQCIQDLPCTQLLVANCYEQARASIAPSATLIAFCDTATQDCGIAGTALETACLENLKVFSDNAINATGSSCLSSPCAERVSCVLMDLGVQ